MDIKLAGNIKIFYAYSPEDRELRDELAMRLGRAYVDHLYDGEILAGETRFKKIEVYLNTADIILLLISPNFMASDDCYRVQKERALERQATGEAHVIPIILRPTDYQGEPFSKLKVLPTGGKPVTSWLDRQEALHDVAVGVRKVITSSLIKQRIKVAKTYSDQGFYKEALVTCEETITHIRSTTSLDYNPALYATLYQVYGDVLEKPGHTEKALEAYDTAISFTPEEAHLYAGKGEILFNLKNFADALIVYTKAISLRRNEPLLHSRRGDVLQQLEHYEDALVAYEAAIRLDRKNADFCKKRGDVLQILKHYDAAIEAYNAAIHLDPQNVTFYIDKVFTLFRKRDYSQALATYEAAIRIEPHNAQIWRNKGKILGDIAQFEAALAAYEEAIRLEPHNPFLYKAEGDIFLKLERLEEALAAFEDAVRLDPDFAHAHCSIGTVLDKLADCAYQKLKQRADHAYHRAKQLGIDRRR